MKQVLAFTDFPKKSGNLLKYGMARSNRMDSVTSIFRDKRTIKKDETI